MIITTTPITIPTIWPVVSPSFGAGVGLPELIGNVPTGGSVVHAAVVGAGQRDCAEAATEFNNEMAQTVLPSEKKSLVLPKAQTRPTYFCHS